MGGSKRLLEEIMDRGYTVPAAHVCPDCVEDAFLKDLLADGVTACRCDCCGRTARKPIAAPMEVLLACVSDAVHAYFSSPDAAGVPWDEGEYVFEPLSTREMLEEIGFSAHEDVMAMVSDAFVNDAWVPASDGNWLSETPSKSMGYAWQQFVSMVKTQRRFFFSSFLLEQGDDGMFRPDDFLHRIGELVGEIGLVRNLAVGSRLFRVRNRDEGDNWEICAREMGIPPAERVRARRMNPSGIGYLYLARERATAIGEVLRRPPCQVAVGEFVVNEQLRILDLGSLPELPSIFDVKDRMRRESILFLQDFISEICKPVARDMMEHVDYVPSQVVSEYFAGVFRDETGQPLDGLAYPSAVCRNGVNVVLFPPVDGPEAFARRVSYHDGRLLDIPGWDDVFQLFRLG